MLKLGKYRIEGQLFVAPMAGVTDLPFRKLCRSFGASYSVSEMVTSNPALWTSLKTSTRLSHSGELAPVAVQIAGTDAAMMTAATVYNIERGAEIIDINMGCPAKKVCHKYAGAALMRDEKQAAAIIAAVVKAAAPYAVPVTLKIRSGWDERHKNALNIATIAQDLGVQMLTVHGRTREQKYSGSAEYDTIATIKQRLSVPVVANGDIDSGEKARYVLDYTGADALMIGRAAQGRPWIFRQISHYLTSGEQLTTLALTELKQRLLQHLQEHYALYGHTLGARTVRKHIGWYARFLPYGQQLRRQINLLSDAQQQIELIQQYFALLPSGELKLT